MNRHASQLEVLVCLCLGLIGAGAFILLMALGPRAYDECDGTHQIKWDIRGCVHAPLIRAPRAGATR